MSWVLGFIGTSLSPTLRERLVALHADPLFRSESPTHYVALGGVPETCAFGPLPLHPGGGWAVVGLGIRLRDDHCAFLDAPAWAARLAPDTPDLDGLDGHFVALRWRPGRLDACTDALGVRTLYLARQPDGVAFSTRLDWLTRAQGGAALNLEAFGAHWLAFNQLSTTCLVHGIQRLGAGGRMTWTPDGPTTEERPWTPEIGAADREGRAFGRTLSALVRPQTDEGRRVSLGLSGGLDSRLLLACRPAPPPVDTHVFGPDDHPDVRIAGRIADREGLLHRRFHAPLPDADACLSLVRTQVAQTQAVSAASSALGLRYYSALHTRGVVLIDGGLGEAARRQFMNRLLRRGPDALRAGTPAAILPYLRAPRADVFNDEARAAMRRGAEDQIAALWDTLPPLQTIGEENFLDLLGVRTRLPNFFGFEQNRLDGVIQNYMPFAQPSLLRAVFQTPVSLRRNGRLFRRLIHERWPSLARYPLVKGGVSYPFRLPTLPAYAWTSLKTYLGRGYTDTARLRFLETVRPFVLDAAHTRSLRTASFYDPRRITTLVEGFYGGRTELAASVDWWLAFEMWRRALGAA